MALLPEIQQPWAKGDDILAARLDAMRQLCNQNRVIVGQDSGLLARHDVDSTQLWLADTASAALFAVELTGSGEAGSISTTCAFVYTVKKLDGTTILTSTAPVNGRIAKCVYAKGTLGLAWQYPDGDYDFYAFDEVPVGVTLNVAVDLQMDSSRNIQLDMRSMTVLAVGATANWVTKLTADVVDLGSELRLSSNLQLLTRKVWVLKDVSDGAISDIDTTECTTP